MVEDVDIDLLDVLILVVLEFEQFDNVGIHRPLFDLLVRDVLDVDPGQVEGMVRLAWVEPWWFESRSATMLNLDNQSSPACLPFDVLIDISRQSISVDAIRLNYRLTIEGKRHSRFFHRSSRSQVSKAGSRLEVA